MITVCIKFNQRVQMKVAETGMNNLDNHVLSNCTCITINKIHTKFEVRELDQCFALSYNNAWRPSRAVGVKK